MCDPITAIAAVASVASAATQYTQGKKAEKNQKQATATADANAKANLKLQDEDNNRKNAKTPNVAALLSQNQNDTTLGGTMLTGVGGVKKTDLQLGKNTLLGE